MNQILRSNSCSNKLFDIHRSAQFKEDEGTWKGNEDGKIVNNQPARVMDDRNGVGPAGGYIAKYGFFEKRHVRN